MKKMTNLICAACLTVTGTLAAMPAPLTASAALIPVCTSGKAGENVTWKYDVDTHTLTFSGTGDMYIDRRSLTMETYEEVHDVEKEFSPRKIVIEEGITGIGCCLVPYTFYNHDEDVSITVSIPGSATEIYRSAFSGFGAITSIVIPENVSSIGEFAFCCPQLRSITILNPKCEIAGESNTISNRFIQKSNGGSYRYYGVIFGAEGSTAEAYAKEFGCEFAVIGTEVVLNPLKPTERGDFNGDDLIGTEDAQNVLIAYSEMLAGNDTKLNALQKDTCDVDRDGDVDISDAQYILIYYTECNLLNPDLPASDRISRDSDWDTILRGESLRTD